MDAAVEDDRRSYGVRHDTTRYRASPIEEQRYGWQKAVEKKDPSGWTLPWEGVIQAEGGEKYYMTV